MKTLRLVLLAFLVACGDAEEPTESTARLRHATLSLGAAKPVGDVVIDHTPTRIAWTVPDPSTYGGLWTAAAPSELTIPADWETGRTLLLCAGVTVANLTPNSEQAAVVIGKTVTENLPLAIQQATATDEGYADMSLCVSDMHPRPGDSYHVLVYAYDAAHGQRVQAYYSTFFQGQQLSE